jgi:hypothetical protein
MAVRAPVRIPASWKSAAEHRLAWWPNALAPGYLQVAGRCGFPQAGALALGRSASDGALRPTGYR